MTRFIFRVSLILCAVLLILTVASRAIGGILRTPILAFEAVEGASLYVLVLDVLHDLSIRPAPGDIRFSQNPVWSADGQLAYTGTTVHGDIHVFDIFSGRLTNINNNSSRNESNPAWSPDGAQLAFISDTESGRGVFIQDMDDLTATQVSPDTDFVQQTPLWSPNGAYLAYGIYVYQLPARLQVIDVSTGDLVASIEGLDLHLSPIPYSWSPDSRYLAFNSNRDVNAEIYILDLHSGTTINVTNQPTEDYSPVFSPDGRYLAFVISTNTGSALYILELATEILTLVSTYVSVSQSWSPDAAQLAFSSNQHGNLEIYIYDLVTGSLANVTNTPDINEYYPAWMP